MPPDPAIAGSSPRRGGDEGVANARPRQLSDHDRRSKAGPDNPFRRGTLKNDAAPTKIRPALL